MIPILYNRNISPKLNSTSQDLGLGMLNDCISATVTEEINGKFELQIEYPVQGIHFDEINYCSWIRAVPYVGGDVNLFRVYKISKPVNGVCTIYAEHVSYMLSYAVVKPANWNEPLTGDADDVLAALTDNIVVPEFAPDGDMSFLFFCNWHTVSETFLMKEAKPIREYLLGNENSIVSVFGGGEFLFNNFSVTLYRQRGQDNGVKIQYGKNLMNLKMDFSDEPIITGYYPYWSKEWPTTQYTPYTQFAFRDMADYGPYNPIYDNETAEAKFWFYPRILPLNLADFERWKNMSADETVNLTITDFEDCIQEYMAAHKDQEKPQQSIEVSFIDLSTTEEYKNIIPLETVNLGDTVTVQYKEFNVSGKLRVVKTEYNVLEERYNQLTLGSQFNALY